MYQGRTQSTQTQDKIKVFKETAQSRHFSTLESLSQRDFDRKMWKVLGVERFESQMPFKQRVIQLDLRVRKVSSKVTQGLKLRCQKQEDLPQKKRLVYETNCSAFSGGYHDPCALVPQGAGLSGTICGKSDLLLYRSQLLQPKSLMNTTD